MSTSGVYQLTFSSGARYIGKSVDIDARWKQHATAFSKGKAAGAMQAEYAKCGYPDGKVLFQCHPDHIDIAEAVFIVRNKPELNSAIPEDPFLGIDDMDEVFSLLGMSTLEHVNQITEISGKYVKELENVKRLNKEIALLKIARSDREVNVEKDRKIASLRNENATLATRLKEVQTMLVYHAQPWWKKVFN